MTPAENIVVDAGGIGACHEAHPMFFIGALCLSSLMVGGRCLGDGSVMDQWIRKLRSVSCPTRFLIDSYGW